MLRSAELSDPVWAYLIQGRGSIQTLWIFHCQSSWATVRGIAIDYRKSDPFKRSADALEPSLEVQSAPELLPTHEISAPFKRTADCIRARPKAIRAPTARASSITIACTPMPRGSQALRAPQISIAWTIQQLFLFPSHSSQIQSAQIIFLVSAPTQLHMKSSHVHRGRIFPGLLSR